MKDLSKISKLMKADWDRRISHDYRFWMSDGYRDDQTMWESGKRDFEILMAGIEQSSEKSILELGCGVGRLLYTAVQSYKHVTGIDVSEKAIQRARKLLGLHPNLTLVQGNGIDFAGIADHSLDLVYSFAAISSIPTDVAANYLREINRVLKPQGILRLQFYTGQEQEIEFNDTLHLRCYTEEHFINAVNAAGFEVEFLKELVLPFKVSYEEIGIRASIASLQKASECTINADEISHLLLPAGERGAEAIAELPSTGDLEGWMALKYAEELAQSGDIEKARETLEYVERHFKAMTIDTSDLLHRIVARVESAPTPVASTPMTTHSPAEFMEKNLRVVRERFPELVKLLEDSEGVRAPIEIKSSAEGPVLFYDSQCLDHPAKPQAAAEVWAKRLLNESRFTDADQIAIYGFANGYHVEALASQTAKKIFVIEPHLPILRAALGARDLTACLTRISNIYIGQDTPREVFSNNTELAMRAQSTLTAPEHAAEVRSRFYGERGLNVLHPRIGVLGPMQGGTLPIGGYCTRALQQLRQRNRFFEMSGFAPGYHLFDQFIFDKARQATSQGHYVEMLSQLLLDAVAEKPIDILLCMALAPLSGRALKELKNRGVITALWFVEDHLRFGYWQHMAPYFDFVFTIQKEPCLRMIKNAGAGAVHYLPVGCDPAVHSPLGLTADERQRWGSPISFVGAGYHNRQQTFAALSGLPFKIWGTEWPECKPFDRMVQEKGRRLAPDEYVKIFNSTDINLNLHSSTERDGVDPYGDFVNPRTFELAACGAFQLVDERTLLPELMQPGKELVTFNSTADLKDKIGYYLSHPEERRQIALQGRERALKEHTYDRRIRQMLSLIYSSKFEELKRREDGGSWSRMLKRAASHEELSLRCRAAFERGEEANLDGLVADILAGKGKLTETEQKLMFLHHVRKQIIRMTQEEAGTR